MAHGAQVVRLVAPTVTFDSSGGHKEAENMKSAHE